MHGNFFRLDIYQPKQAINQATLPAYPSLLPFPGANQPQYPSVVLRLLQTDIIILPAPYLSCSCLYKEEPPRGGIALLPLSTGHTSYASDQTDQQGEGKDRRAARTEQATPKRAQTRLVGFRAVQPPSFAPLFLQSVHKRR